MFVNDNHVYKTIYDPNPYLYEMPTSAAFSGFTSSNKIGIYNGCDGRVHHLKGKTGEIPAQSRYCNGELNAKCHWVTGKARAC